MHELNRKQFLTSLGAMALGAGFCGRSAQAAQAQPNIVMLIADTLRADVLGCYGCPHDTSPELDAIAQEGVVFESALAPSNWTLPSTASLLTSQHGRSLGLYESTHYFQDLFPTLPEVLQQHGYLTMGITANAVINSVAGFGRGFDEYIDTKIDWESEGPRTKRSDEIFKTSLALAAKKDARPAYLQINIMEPHEYYRGEGKLTRSEFCDLFPDVQNHANRRDYLQSTRQVSVDTAAFVKELYALPGWEDTLLVILSDHGEGLDDHPNVWRADRHGTMLYESMVRVPLIFHHPRGIKAARFRQHVRLLDVMPTLLAYVGAAAPGKMVGQPLVSLLRGDPAGLQLPEHFISEVFTNYGDKSAVFAGEGYYIFNRDLHAGCNEHELQMRGTMANGKATDQRGKSPDKLKELGAYLERWESLNPKVPAIDVSEVSDVGDRAQELEALGYLG